MPRSDLHQHLWPEELLRALAQRVEPPRLRHGADGWTLELPGEPPCPVARADHDPVTRALEAERDGVDVVGIALGRASHPRLRVLFAMLAGGAPLHGERLAARGGPAAAVHDELTFFDVSSYGPRTVDAMLRVVGADRLVHGSDRPIADPPALGPLGPSVAHALAEANPERLLSPDPVTV